MTRSSKKRGFSLIETLVAITILVTALVGPMTIAARGLQGAYFARDQITATLLAQEGIEMVREKRDSHALAVIRGVATSDDWYNEVASLNNCKISVSPSGCAMDIRDPAVTACGSGPDYAACRLNYDATIGSTGRGIYTHITGTGIVTSPFVRRISLSGNSTDATVTVTVSWSSSFFGGQKEVVLQSHIFNHYDAY